MPLVIFDSDETTVQLIRKSLGDAKQIHVFLGNGPTATSACALDALWVTAMQGERFGLSVNLAPGECVIGQNSPEMVAKGLPRHIVACGTDNHSNWLQVAVRAVVRTISDFNTKHETSDAICRVGTIPENLGLTHRNVDSVMTVLKGEWDV